MTTKSNCRNRNRRALLGLAAALAGGLATPLTSGQVRAAAATPPQLPLPTHTFRSDTLPATADEAMTRLKEGNSRFVTRRVRHPHQGRDRLRAVSMAQHPFAMVLGCIDSRVPPEQVFDQGLGDLLCIRTAGQALDGAVLGSIQYGIEELGVRLVVVLGHERCGAVSAAVEHARSGTSAQGHLARVVEQIAPAALETRGPASSADWVEQAVRANVTRVRHALSADPAFGGATVAGARFDLDTGRVSFHPF
ncbi:carbonic anhydrase [Streptomyces spiroverticillatus]|uniref:Carbonic anhydrase n=1 Tax=Streptomyces finlayi TaxID=67296 RepID=A0A918X3W0_9ACTN|nr:carbonic anhydrase [Streptomyces finlayi]GHA26198.1 carbonic anhydrase [Streptomyces spiroverticillatus]GHD07766.1 carbonic anhydrase [Streptomyces finlayi]